MKSYRDAVSIGGLAMRNRIVRSATFEYAADSDGRFSGTHAGIYADLARGGVGAVITGMVAVDDNSRLNAAMVKGNGDAFEDDLSALAERMRALECPLVVQLSHCGVKASLIKDGGSPYGPSAVPLRSGGTGRAMTTDAVAGLAESFADVAARCQSAGAHAVQLHAAHGYCLSQFLSPYYNKRDDAYGKDIAGRAGALFEVYDAVRRRVGSDYPVWVKINGADMTDPGMTFEESAWVCAELDKRGIDAIELSGGINEGPESFSARLMKEKDGEGFYAENALALAGRVRADVISVGGYRTPEGVDAWLNKGNIAGISLSRPLISEPDLVNRWNSGDGSRARCISCRACYKSTGRVTCQAFQE